jgi:hypothetical protein
MAVSLERSYANLLGQNKGLLVEDCSLLNGRGITPRYNLAEEAQGIRFIAAFPVRTGEC